MPSCRIGTLKVLVRFLRGLLTNHDTPPALPATRSIPIRPRRSCNDIRTVRQLTPQNSIRSITSIIGLYPTGIHPASPFFRFFSQIMRPRINRLSRSGRVANVPLFAGAPVESDSWQCDFVREQRKKLPRIELPAQEWLPLRLNSGGLATDPRPKTSQRSLDAESPTRVRNPAQCERSKGDGAPTLREFSQIRKPVATSSDGMGRVQ